MSLIVANLIERVAFLSRIFVGRLYKLLFLIYEFAPQRDALIRVGLAREFVITIKLFFERFVFAAQSFAVVVLNSLQIRLLLLERGRRAARCHVLF